MATEWNINEETLASIMDWHAISLNSEDINIRMVPMGSYYGLNTSGEGMILQDHSSFENVTPPGIIQPGNGNGNGNSHASASASSLIFGSAPALRHDSGLAVEWSVEEQCILEQGIQNRFKNEPNTMKYVRIGSSLPEKTVRDVALRCAWMKRKGKKELNARKKGKKVNIPLPKNKARYPFMKHHVGQSEAMQSEVYRNLGMSDIVAQLLKRNCQAFDQISANFSTYQVLDNIDLFYQSWNNISGLLNEIQDANGLMSQMSQFPELIHEEDLVNLLVPGLTQPVRFESCGDIWVKDEG